MIDARTIGAYVASMGWSVKRGRTTGGLLVAPPFDGEAAFPLPPFRVDVVEHWVQLVLGPIFEPDASTPEDLHLRLLTVNRDLRLAKFGVDDRGAVVLCAELPTESLDKEEVVDAVERLVRYLRHYRAFLAGD